MDVIAKVAHLHRTRGQIGLVTVYLGNGVDHAVFAIRGRLLNGVREALDRSELPALPFLSDVVAGRHPDIAALIDEAYDANDTVFRPYVVYGDDGDFNVHSAWRPGTRDLLEFSVTPAANAQAL
jgi:hypothetical protein